MQKDGKLLDEHQLFMLLPIKSLAESLKFQNR